MSKLTDAGGENAETDTSLDMAHDCGYITDAEHAELTAECGEIGRMLGAVSQSPEKSLTSDLVGGGRSPRRLWIAGALIEGTYIINDHDVVQTRSGKDVRQLDRRDLRASRRPVRPVVAMQPGQRRLDGTVGLLYETGDSSAYDTLAFVRFDMDWLTQANVDRNDYYERINGLRNGVEDAGADRGGTCPEYVGNLRHVRCASGLQPNNGYRLV